MLNLDKNKKYLLACSFGPDSMALFSMLLKEGYNFKVAYVNYNLREESVIEEEKLTEYCLKNNIELYKFIVPPNSIKGNLESKCRDIRYSFFQEVYEEYAFDALLVAHHLDDLIETYLIQKNRKSKVSYYGLSGQRMIFGMNVIRPLLNFSKQELLDYCESNNVPFMIDKTNLEPIYLRNKIRLEIIQKMNKEDKELMLKEIDKNNENNQNLRDFLTNLDLNSVKDMSNLDKETFAYAINESLNKSGLVNDMKVSISQRFANEILKALKSNKANIKIHFKNNIYFVKSYDQCYFSVEFELEGYSYDLSSPGILDTEYFYLNFLGDTSNRNISIGDYPLTITTADKNDTFMIKDYKTKIRRAYIDWKMPLKLRKIWPVIKNKDGKVIYVPRYKANFIPSKEDNFYVKIQ